MKLSRKIIALCLGATLALGSTFGLAACNGNNDDTGSAGDPNIRLVYNMYVENCAAKGEEALTYEDWLASIKGEDGEDGKDGVTPHIGANGNWYIGEEDTKIKAEGADGKNGTTPHIDTESGHWFVGETDTGIPATGAKGDPGDDGDDGKDGSSFLHGKGKPDAALGSEGDLYLDLETYDLYEKTAEGWSTDPVGNIKGAKGDKGDKGDSAAGSETVEPMPSGTVVKEYKGVTIEGSGTYSLDLTDVAQGCYWLVAKTETTATEDVLSVDSTIKYKPGRSTLTTYAYYDLYSKKYKGFRGIAVVTPLSGSGVVVSNHSEENISADLQLIQYEAETLKAGQEIEIPCLSYQGSAASVRTVPLGLDSSLVGKSVKITFTDYPLTTNDDCPKIYYEGGDVTAWTELTDFTDKYTDGVWSTTVTIPDTAEELIFMTKDTSVTYKGYNVIVKIELAS